MTAHEGNITGVERAPTDEETFERGGYLAAYDAAPEEREGGACRVCGEPAMLRRCRECGVTAWIIDCGHYDQPRPISAYGADSYCDDCFAAIEENRA